MNSLNAFATGALKGFINGALQHSGTLLRKAPLHIHRPHTGFNMVGHGLAELFKYQTNIQQGTPNSMAVDMVTHLSINWGMSHLFKNQHPILNVHNDFMAWAQTQGGSGLGGVIWEIREKFLNPNTVKVFDIDNHVLYKNNIFNMEYSSEPFVIAKPERNLKNMLHISLLFKEGDTPEQLTQVKDFYFKTEQFLFMQKLPRELLLQSSLFSAATNLWSCYASNNKDLLNDRLMKNKYTPFVGGSFLIAAGVAAVHFGIKARKNQQKIKTLTAVAAGIISIIVGSVFTGRSWQLNNH